MSIEDTKAMIDALANDNTVDAEKHIKNALADKVGTELDQRRKDLAGTLLNKEQEAETNVNTEPTEIDD